jgi:hypothetical protein
LKKNEEEKMEHRHNELGYALIKTLIDKRYGFNGKNENIDLVTYTTLFHHELFNEETSISLIDYYSIEELKDVAIFFNELFKEYELDNFIRFKEDINEEMLEDSISLNNRIFGFIQGLTLYETKKILKDFK